MAPLTAAESRYRAAGRLPADEHLTCQAQLLVRQLRGRVPEAMQLPHQRYVG